MINESVNARIAGCKLSTSARTFFFFSLIHEQYNKQLNNLDRSVVMGKSTTSAYHIYLAIARSIRHCLLGRGFICNRIGFDAVTPFVYTAPVEFVKRTGSF